MKRHLVTQSGIDSIDNIKSIIRGANPGEFTISLLSDAKQGYNDPSLYLKNRAVAVIPNSTASNTLITNDGIVVVFRAEDIVEVLDLFEESTYDYNADIQPEDYQQLIDSFRISEHTKTFTFEGSAGNLVTVNNLLYYQDETYSYFTSEFDLDLPTDEYGYYKVETANWSNYETIDQYPVMKKQFLTVLIPDDEIKFYADGSLVEEIISFNNLDGTFTFVYRFNDLDFSSSAKFTIGLEAINATYGTIKII